MVDLPDLLDRVEDPAKAREVLRTYIAVRRERYRRPGTAPFSGAITLLQLVARLERFTAVSSEGGKRAQAGWRGSWTRRWGPSGCAPRG